MKKNNKTNRPFQVKIIAGMLISSRKDKFRYFKRLKDARFFVKRLRKRGCRNLIYINRQDFLKGGLNGLRRTMLIQVYYYNKGKKKEIVNDKRN